VVDWVNMSGEFMPAARRKPLSGRERKTEEEIWR
jgi:hypothetical protein